jgi:hypothetical protein
MSGPDRLTEVVAQQALPPASSAGAQAVAREVVERGGAVVRGILFFGSRKSGAAPDAFSAYDLFVVVESYGPFYRHLARTGVLRGRWRVAALLNRLLPPNQVSISADGPPGASLRAKCAVISAASFRRGCSPRRRDHFVLGRLIQPVEVLFAADEDVRKDLVDGMVSAHRLTYAWVRPWLPSDFDVDDYTRTLLRVSYAGEIRPEPSARAETLWRRDREALAEAYAPVLDELVQSGDLRPAGRGRFRARRPASRLEGLRGRIYFRWSLVRATVRWAKYIVTFEGWLDFILRKARRHSGQDLELSPRERRYPLIFLWPRVVRYLRQKDAPHP